MSRRYASQLAHNEQVHQVFIASDKNLRPNRNGNLYMQVGLSDRSGTIDARLWNASEKDYKDFLVNLHQRIKERVDAAK